MTAPKPLRLPALDPGEVTSATTSNYPDPFKPYVSGRNKRRLGEVLGLKNFGVNLTTLKPGAQSALRHWHKTQDEFVFVLEGELVLVTTMGEQLLQPGMCAGFPAGFADGHCLINRSAQDATYLEVGDRTEGDRVTYPDDDLACTLVDGKWRFQRRDGTTY
jgi:uncharacterized cupin superfamily protein